MYVLACVVFVVLLVASVLASMRWLLCGGDGSKRKNTKSVILQKKIPRGNFSILVFNLFEKLDPHQITNITDLILSKNK